MQNTNWSLSRFITGCLFIMTASVTVADNNFMSNQSKTEVKMKDAGDPYELIQTEAHRCKAKGECGWWFGFIDPAEVENKKKEDERQQQAAKQRPESKEEKCGKKDTWSDDCGWTDPGGDFEFLVMQREKLSQNALMFHGDQKHVKEFQKFMLWLVDAAVSYSKTVEFNQIQDQSLNPYARHPVSAFGLRAAVRTKNEHTLGIFNEIKKQDGVLVFFTRSDCSFCHTQVPIIRKLALLTGLDVVNVSLDEMCMEGYEGERCITADKPYILEAITAIGINVVPDLFLFLPKDNKDNNGWVRVSTGNEAVSTIKRRIRMFFEGVRSASIAGLSEASNSFSEQRRPNATFDTEYNSDYTPGTTFTKEPLGLKRKD